MRRPFRSLFLVVPALLTVALPLTARADVLLVHPDGSGPYATIQDAIVAAAPGDTVALTAGTFRGFGNRDLEYFGAAITVMSQSGNPADCIIDCEADSSWRCRGVFFHWGEGPGSVLRGVTIMNGWAPTACGNNTGGGLYCAGGTTPTIVDCVFTGNQGLGGGGASCREGASPVFTRCHFVANSCDQFGAGVYCGDGGEALLRECTFSGNHGSSGGGISCNGGSARLEDCRFENNSADFGGGFHCVNTSSPTLLRCFFTGNTATFSGGGAAVEAGPYVVMTECTFAGNTASMGGGLSCWLAQTVLTGCTFYQSRGGTIRGGGIDCWEGGRVDVRNTIIASSTRGPAVHCEDPGSAALVCCDLFANSGGDWTDCIAGQAGINGNISRDPLFCNAATADFHLAPESPCAPLFNPSCDLIGAWPVGCDLTAAPEISTEMPVDAASGGVSLRVPAVSGGAASILYTIPPGDAGARFLLAVYDATGRLTATLAEGAATPGPHTVVWDGRNGSGHRAARGQYFCRLRVEDRQIVRRMTVLR